MVDDYLKDGIRKIDETQLFISLFGIACLLASEKNAWFPPKFGKVIECVTKKFLETEFGLMLQKEVAFSREAAMEKPAIYKNTFFPALETTIEKLNNIQWSDQWNPPELIDYLKHHLLRKYVSGTWSVITPIIDLAYHPLERREAELAQIKKIIADDEFSYLPQWAQACKISQLKRNFGIGLKSLGYRIQDWDHALGLTIKLFCVEDRAKLQSI